MHCILSISLSFFLRSEAAAQTAGYSEELGSARSTIDSMREQLSSWQQKYGEVEIGIRDLKKQLISTAAQVIFDENKTILGDY